ncbi:pyoverdine synthetase E, pdvE [Isoalcanivorax pacificus W11-5]|uniref:Pyoverdine synthetase E, pdvE n=1 Tax=Isoalcanivorax pacificus W11-5 TaxID=391936 RepID=A0A0B4XLU2_9GAMM|nr:cyclic peptide export ABC transporter [Isoalcanivorax pacificus]AJD47503.1 pyoverdine synthetase E, pdvE [Isoalcanivorax pacificus W11-5]
MLALLLRQSRRRMLVAVIASVLSGLCGVLLVAQINSALSADEAARTQLAWTFAALAVGMMITRALAAMLSEQLGQYALARLRHVIAARVMAADFRQVEQLGSARVQSALAEHSTNVAQFFVSVPAILNNAVVVLACLVYMALLSWQVLLAAVVVIGLGSLGYHLAHLRALGHLSAASVAQDGLFGYFRALTDGAKELRLHRDKRQRFLDDVLGQSIESVRHARATGMSIFVASASWGNFLIYAFIGLVLFVLVGDVPDRARIMTGFALIFVYMVTPLEVLLMNIPRANLARVSAARIEEITTDIGAETPAGRTAPTQFRRLSLQGVRHRYYHEQSDEFFELGPIDLAFSPGTVTFLIGGNGSGKTTLAKLLAGLYTPEEGTICLDGEPVTERDRDDYRQLFSAVFSDFHLFDRLLEAPGTASDEAGNRLLARLHLQHKVQVRNGAFTTQALSQGQRKRLALVVACLEDRPFLIFDEWAADQDPVFKEVFYHEVLPALREQGKAVLVISHDDRYFDAGDRLLRLDSGRLSPLQAAPPARAVLAEN